MPSIALVVLVAISSIINLIFASVENINHQIDKIDKTIYQKRNLIVCVQSSVNAENVLKKYVA